MAETKVREVKMGRRAAAAMGPKPKIDNPGKILVRLFKVCYGEHKFLVACVLFLS